MATVRLMDDGEAIGLVDYTANLDHWDGHNFTCGSTGHHLGIGKLKDGRFYACHGTQWQGERDYAEVISETEAKKLCLSNDPDVYGNLFGEPAPVADEV